jgi:hypothetical protein
MLKSIIASIILLSASWSVQAAPTPEQPDRNEEAYNLEDQSLGLKGFDPVAYFSENGGEALQGDPEISLVYGNVLYRFSSTENKNLFMANPTKYEPTYGGWCAWAMANDSYADINPMLFTQHGNRMHFFISRGAKARFDADLEFHESNADDFWKSESGESPRK